MQRHDVQEATLGGLLGRAGLHLRLEGAATPELLARPITGVHSSDLPDPTPFLIDGIALLTTGTQFADAGSDAYNEYVARLLARGVSALGFGTEVARDGIPDALADACREQGLALFEVPYRTPFIAVARANAEAIAAEDYARRTWALDAQRALSLAALRTDGLSATVSELARQLGTWVGLFDAAGALLHGDDTLTPGVLAQLQTDVADVLRRGARAGSSLRIEDVPFSLQTLGRGGHLRGALAVASAELDREARSVVTTVVAMAGLALEQRQHLTHARHALRAGLATALVQGETALPRRVARSIWGGFPQGSVVFAITDAAVTRRDDALEWLETTANETTGALFYGRVDDGILLVLPAADIDILARFASRFALTVGVSAPATVDGCQAALEQARIARDRGTGLSDFARLQPGVLSLLEGSNAGVLAASQLAPLLTYDAEQGTQLVATLRAWLDGDASHESAARTLGVHRHTVRARLALAEKVQGRDFSGFDARAELWLALRALG